MSWILTDEYIRDTTGLGESTVCKFRNTPELHKEDLDDRLYKIVTDNDEVFDFFKCLLKKNNKHKIESLVLENKQWYKERIYKNGYIKEKEVLIKGCYDEVSKYQYSYDCYNRVTTVMNNGRFDSHRIYYGDGGDGKLFKLINSSMVISHTYDDKGNLLTKTFEYKRGNDIKHYYFYDEKGNLTAVTCTNGGWAHYTHNSKGSVLTHTNPTQHFEYTYADDGVTKISMVSGYDRWDFVKGTKNKKLLKFDVSNTTIHRR